MSGGAEILAVQSRGKECKKEGLCDCHKACHFVLCGFSASPDETKHHSFSSPAKCSLDTVQVTAYLLFTFYMWEHLPARGGAIYENIALLSVA